MSRTDALPPNVADGDGMASLERRLAGTRVAARVGAVALVALCVAWELWLAPTGRGTLALKAVPLLPAIAGLCRDRLYTYRWLSLLVWLYVAEGAVRATSEHGAGRWLAVGELLLCAGLFAACAAQVRWRLAFARLAPGGAAGAAAPAG